VTSTSRAHTHTTISDKWPLSSAKSPLCLCAGAMCVHPLKIKQHAWVFTPRRKKRLASVNSGLYVEGQAAARVYLPACLRSRNRGADDLESGRICARESATKQAQQRGRRGWARQTLLSLEQRPKYWHSFFTGRNAFEINVWVAALLASLAESIFVISLSAPH
jgi:hypothetical protein